MFLNPDEAVTITDFFGQPHRYFVDCRLGDGYLADVYLVRDMHNDDPAVMKVLKQRHLGTNQKSTEFLREADFLQQLIHLPEVVNLRRPGKGEIVLEEGTRLPCTLQEYIEEPFRPLPELVEEGLSEATGLSICRQFASLLTQIHAKDIVYTDLKPEHIYWDGTHIKVIDWNVVKDLSTADQDTIREAVAKELQAFGQAMYFTFTGQTTVSRADGPSATALISGNLTDTHIDFESSTTGKELSLGTKLIIERSLSEGTANGFSSAEALEEALAQHLARLNQTADKPAAQTRAALSKGLAALEAGDYDDAIRYFTEAAHHTPGLITQSHLVATRIRQDDDLSDAVKDQVEEKLTLYRASLQEGDLTTALDALDAGQAAVPEHQEIEVLRGLTSQVAEAIDRSAEALAAADYTAAREALRSATALEPSASFLREQLQAVEAFETHLQAGTEALEAGRYSEAAAAFETLISNMPQSASIEKRWITARLGQGNAALERGAFAEAREAFVAVLDHQPENEEARSGMAAVEAGQERMQQLRSLLVKARTAYQVGDYEKSLECVNAALELEPEHEEATQLLAEVRQAQQAERSRRVRRWLEKGHQAMADDAYAEAIQCFEQAATLDPESEASVLRARAEAAQARAEQFQALLHKAHAAFRGEDYNTAVRYFEEAIDLAPEALDARRGLTLARQRQAEVRAQEVQSALAAGRAALSAGEYQDALRHFERAADLGSDSQIAEYIEKAFQIRDLIRSAQDAEERGDLQEALTYYTRAVDIDPLPGLEAQLTRIHTEVQAATGEQVTWLIEQATEHLESNPDKAVQWLQQACELDPNHAQAIELLSTAKENLYRRQQEVRRLVDIGDAELNAGDGKAAGEAFAKALELEPNLAEAQAGQAQARQLVALLEGAEKATQREKREQAVAQLEQALEIAPESPHVQQRWRQARCEVLLHNARAAGDEGDYSEALSLVDKVLDLDVDHPAGHELRETLQAEAKAAAQAEKEASRQTVLEQVETLWATADDRMDVGDYHAALQAIESAQELVPGDVKLAQRRQNIIQKKARHDRARALLNEARRLELSDRHDEAAEAYEIAAHLTPDSSLEAEARVRSDQARGKHRLQRVRSLVRRIVGLSESKQTETLGKDRT